jgi:hypothetical protein
MDSNTDTKTTIKEICINPADFVKDNLVWEDAATSSFKVGELPVDNTTSEAFYLDEHGEKCAFFFTGPTQPVFGVSLSYPLGTPETDQTPDKVKGLQICYPMTSLKTMKAPTPEEAAYRKMIVEIWESAYAHGAAQVTSNPAVPGISVNSFMAAAAQKKRENAIKVPFDYRNDKKDKTKKDFTKPEQMYVKLYTKGQGLKIRCETKFYGPGDTRLNGMSLVDEQGALTPVFKLEGMYFGSHGPRAPQGASVRIRLNEANWVPGSIGGAKVSTQRFTAPNAAVAEKPKPPSNSPPPTNTGFAPADVGGVAAIAAIAKGAAKPSAQKGAAKPSAPKPAAPKVGSKPTAPATGAGKPAASKPKPKPKPVAKPPPPPVEPEAEAGEAGEEQAAE